MYEIPSTGQTEFEVTREYAIEKLVAANFEVNKV